MNGKGTTSRRLARMASAAKTSSPGVLVRVAVRGPRGDGDPALRVAGHLTGGQAGGEGRPVEAEIRADAGIAGDAQPVPQQEIVDRAHRLHPALGGEAAVDRDYGAGDETGGAIVG